MTQIPRAITALVAVWLASRGYSLLTAPQSLISAAIAAVAPGES